jgi:hypothetical protein
MPAYAKDGKVVCFFQSAQKFKTRYATFGFMHEANLDEGAMWPTAFALKELTAAEEARIGALGFDVSQPWGKQTLRGAEVGWEKMIERLTGVFEKKRGRRRKGRRKGGATRFKWNKLPVCCVDDWS